MCLYTREILNPRIKGGTFQNVHDPLYLVVPCGRCYECLVQKQQQLICRNYFQFVNNEGSVFYYTLTYDENNVLRIPNTSKQFESIKMIKDKTLKGFSLVPIRSYSLAFNPQLTCKFIKRIRARLKRLKIDLKYYLVSELGSNTFRPHHHVIFYLSKYFDAHKFYDLVLSTWKYGFIKAGSYFGVVVSPAAIVYCSKYLSKDGKKKGFNAKEKVRSHIVLARYIERHFGNYRRLSAGVGWSGRVAQLLTPDVLASGKMQVCIEGKYKQLPIPLYYYRKMCCTPFVNLHGNISYRLNSFGWQVLAKQFNLLYDSLYNQCEKINSRYETNFCADELLNYRLRNSLPLSKMRFSDRDLFMQRKINNGLSGDKDYNTDTRYFLSLEDAQRIVIFKHLNSLQSYENYCKNARSYNVRQRVMYGSSKNEVKILKFKEYAYSSS